MARLHRLGRSLGVLINLVCEPEGRVSAAHMLSLPMRSQVAEMR